MVRERQIILDTETTGLYADRGDRMLEFAGIEMKKRQLTMNNLHLYIHPDRDIPEEAAAVHGITLEQHRSEKWFEATTAARASLIHGFMEEVVQEGTGTAAALRGVRVAGKTGTAENSGEDHAWFIGSAEIKGRKVAFAILVENSGGGGTEAAPIARKLLEKLQDD